MKKELENDFIKGNSSHKVTVQDDHTFVSNCRINRSNNQRNKKGTDHEDLTFSQQGKGNNNNDDDIMSKFCVACVVKKDMQP